ncbi:MAG: sugar phosphate isomerase/epimerase [Acidobacteria bacterium]|nr:sugar phosphate isomerase/epimerase [Acidobacteriota bacterium]
MTRRQFTAMPLIAPSLAAANDVQLGIDLFSVRSQGWTAFEHLDYAAKFGAKVVHFSEIRFLGSLEDEHVKKVAAHAKRLGITLEIGMRSVCPTSALFDPKQGTAEEQLKRVIHAAHLADSRLVRCFLGSMADRVGSIPLEGHIENTAQTLRACRTFAQDHNIRIAVENHAGDMQARELKSLIELAGKDFTGAVIDSGNPVWALEDPHLTLETLAPYILTSHVRDSYLWKTPEGIAVQWTRMGEGNVDIAQWVRRYRELCPGKALSMEIIVTGARKFEVFQRKFWDAYRNTPAWEFSRFLAIAEKGTPQQDPPKLEKDASVTKERRDLELSIEYTQKLLS